ncbi:MAG: Holliday junction branch migration protein RuvA [Propionibacteriaceae bacterium]|jgi:Holliday junction DNA helicase RuvA|nr:Holliday junction branch migration protein RuvA [Propionibacteriaceae bacterium]
MIAQLTGRLLSVQAASAVIDVGGVGFLVYCPPAAVADARVGQTLTLHTHLAVREDALTLYGFASVEDRDAFVLIQSVTGIGAKIALAVMTQLTAAQLRQAILTENLVVLSAVPGIGKKTAQRLILELSQKAVGLAASDDEAPSVGQSVWREQVVMGLTGLGYSLKDAEAAWEAVSREEGIEAMSVSQLMRDALRSLARN